MVVRLCRATNDNGEPCRATPLSGSDSCLMHSPDHAEEVAEARRLGGLRRRREVAVGAAYEFEGLQTVDQIRRLVEVAVIDSLSLENSIARNRTLAYLAQVGVKLLDVGELDERVAALEAAVLPRPSTGRRP